MSFTITRNNPSNLISIPLIYATLKNVNTSFYTYVVSYEANPVVAVRQSAYIVNIRVEPITQTNISSRPTIIKNASGYQLIDNIRKFGGLNKSTGLVSAQAITSIASDLSSRIPNDALRRISALGREENSVVIRTGQQLVTRRVSELDQRNEENPVLTLNVNNPATVDNGAVNQVTLQNTVARDMTNLLFEGRIDPAALSTKKTNTVVYPVNTVGGVAPARPYTARNVFKYDQRSLNVIASQLSTSTKTKPMSQTSLNNDGHITVVEVVNTTLIKVNEQINVSVREIGKNDFYLVFEVKNKSGQILQTERRLVPHGANLSNIVPAIPPIVKRLPRSTAGRAIFQIKQVDPNAKGVMIYRREINPKLPLIDATYTLIDKVPLLAGRDPVIYEDRFATINNVIYRVVPYISDQVPGSVFASIPIQFSRNNILKKEPVYRRQVCAVLNYKLLTNSILIEVSKYPVEAIVIKLYRRNRTIHQKPWTLVKTSELLRTTSSTSIAFEDNQVDIDNDYEYKAVFIYPDGGEHTAYNNVIITFNPITQKVATTSITNPVVGNYNGRDTITFSVNYSLFENNFELIKKLITEQNLLSEYEINLLQNKEQFRTLLSYAVTRVNLTTGEIEEFGIVPSTNFNDRLYGLARNVKDLNRYHEYVYKITTYVRRPETLMPNLVRTVNTTVEGRPVSYQIKPYKWLQPITLNQGNIVTDRSLATNHPRIQLAQGSVVDIIESPKITLSNPLPNLTNANASQISDDGEDGTKSILIEWKVDGDIAKIDHFIIKLEIYGMPSIVGNVHNVSTNNTFKFVDLLTNGEKGPLTYFIVPVYYDYNQGSPIKTNTVVI